MCLATPQDERAFSWGRRVAARKGLPGDVAPAGGQALSAALDTLLALLCPAAEDNTPDQVIYVYIYI